MEESLTAAMAGTSALQRQQEQKELAPQPSQSLRERLAANEDEVADNRMSGYDLTFERMRSRRTGGAFVEKDQTIRLGLQDVIEKGQYSRSDKEERFVEPGSARTLAYNFAELEGSMARFLEFEALADRERDVNAEDERAKKEAELAAQRLHEEIEAQKLAEIERVAAMVQQQTDEWESQFYAANPLDREPTLEDIAKLSSMKMDLMDADSAARREMNDPAAIRAGTTARPLDIPLALQDACKLPEELEQLIETKKQFNEIDFDHSGQIDAHELRTVLKKMGINLPDDQLRTLLAEGDQSDDAELDFEEFIAFIKRFESTQTEKSHMAAHRKGMTGLADAMLNINLQKADDGSSAVARKEQMAWCQLMEYPDPLHWAAGKGDLLALKQFLGGLDKAPVINADRVNKDGKTALHYAAIWKRDIIMKYLLDPVPHGAEVHIDPSDHNFVTPLFMAAEQGVDSSVEYLVKRWANWVHTNAAGSTPLHSAANLNHSKVVDILVNCGAVVSAADDQTIRLWAIDDVERMRFLVSDRAVNRQTGQMGSVYCMQVDQDRIATGHVDGTVRYSSVTTQQHKPFNIKGLEGTRVFKPKTTRESPCLCLKIQSTDTTVPGHLMVTGSEDCSVRLWDMLTAHCIRVYEDKRPMVHPSPVTAVDLDVSGDRIISGTRQGLHFIWSMSTGEMLNFFNPHLGTAVNVAEIRGPLIMTAANDRTIRMMDLDTNKPRVFYKHESGVTSCAWLDEEHSLARQWEKQAVLVSGSNTGELFVWDWDGTDGKTIYPLKTFGGGGDLVNANAHRGPVYDLKVVHCGAKWLLLACSTPESGICIWNMLAPDRAPPLHRLLGHKDDIRCVGWYGVDVNLTDARGLTALMLAAERGLEDSVARLLACAGINVWLGDKQYCETPIHRAARYGHVTVMRMLLEFDPSLIYACTSDNSTVLHRAVEDHIGGPACSRLAMQYGAEVNLMDDKGETALHRAAAFGRYRVLQVLAEFSQLDVDAVGSEHPIGGLPLFRPSNAPREQKYPKLVKMPVQFVSTGRRWVTTHATQRKAFPTQPEVSGYAAPLRRKAVAVKEFMTLRHHLGWTALHMACAMGRPAAVKVLIDMKANVNRADDGGRYPLHLAAANGIPDQIMLLLRGRADCNARDCMGATALHYAVKVAQEDAIKMLVRMCGNALDINSEEETDGLTALHMAAQYGLDEIAYLLLEAGANVNAPDRRVCTALHHAVGSVTVGKVHASAPMIPTVIKVHAFNAAATDKSQTFLRLWNDNLLSLKGLGCGRLLELRREVEDKYARFFDTAQVLLDANARFDLKDATGRTALDYAKLSYDDWPLFKKLFEESSPDGRTYLVSNDLVTATYLGDRGTKFEHPNLWEMVSGFGVRCTQGYPRLNGSRAFKRALSKFSTTEVDYRSLGEFKVGQTGELFRAGCTVYILALEYVEEYTGLKKEAHTVLCAWQPKSRRFETKYNAQAMNLERDKNYDFRVLSVQEWADVDPRVQ